MTVHPDLPSLADTALGIELGSTRIKAVLIGADYVPIATGSCQWRAELINGLWTYDLAEIWRSVQRGIADLAADLSSRYGADLTHVGSIGISAMMHGYLAFDRAGELLVPFRTWQNTSTSQAADELTQLFGFKVPQRWSIAHLYQAILNGEEHVARVDYLTTLAGYVHWQLTGQRVLGIGDASGMFPVQRLAGGYDTRMLALFDGLVASHSFDWQVTDLLPIPLLAGTNAGTLTQDGARLLDASGTLRSGCPLAPPEGDAGTGMVATNSVAPGTANVSAGTSIFAMAVMEQDLGRAYPEIDIVTTPDGLPVAMVHCNNGAVELQKWIELFGEVAAALGQRFNTGQLYEALIPQALLGEADGGGLLAYNFLAGEPVVGFEVGRPLLVRLPESQLSLANFVRTQLFAVLGALRVGMDILVASEGVQIDSLFAHGGLFKTSDVGQRLLAAALAVPVSVGQLAGEGGAWGMALLAAFQRHGGGDLAAWLASAVFSRTEITTVAPQPEDVAGFEIFMRRYRAGLAIEEAAVSAL